MKEEFTEAYQRRIEQIKMLDASPEEKRKLAADAKDEILERYRNSYIKEKERDTRSQVQPRAQAPVSKVQEDYRSSIPAAVEDDPIDNIINKLEEREERGEIAVEVEESSELIDPNSLFSTMDLSNFMDSAVGDFSNDNFAKNDFLDDDDDDDDEFSNDFMDTDQLFGSLLDDGADSQFQEPAATGYQSTANEFDLYNYDQQPAQQPVQRQVPPPPVQRQVPQQQPVQRQVPPPQPAPRQVPPQQTRQVPPPPRQAQRARSFETDVFEVEELVEGSIVDEDDFFAQETRNFDKKNVKELEELEKERERAQKIGIIEIVLLVVLIILVIFVVRLIIGV